MLVGYILRCDAPSYMSGMAERASIKAKVDITPYYHFNADLIPLQTGRKSESPFIKALRF